MQRKKCLKVDKVRKCPDFFAVVLSLISQDQAPVVMVKLRVVRLLGHLGGQMNRNLVTGEELLFN